MYIIGNLVRLVLLLVIAYLLYKVLWKGERISFRWIKSKKDQNPHPQAALEEMERDPVCGTFLPQRQAVKLKHAGETHYFCSEECKQKFLSTQKR